MEVGGRCRQLSITEEFGRLDVVLDRSWEVQPVTWSALTWWDPLPCGKELIASLGNTEPLPFPSPALSVVGHPPTPRRKLPPQALNFRSSSASPSPNNRHFGQLVMAGGTWDGIHPLPDRQGRGQRYCQAVPGAPGTRSRGQCHCRDQAMRQEKDH